MSRDILENIIEDFNPDKFILFFRNKNRTFSPRKEELNQYNDESFKNGLKLGEINFAANEQMIVCIFEASQPLSERTGKKAQYEKGKKILRERQADSGIFIFCDKKGDFRFSLIYANYLGKKRDWSTFRRFTYFVSRELTNKTFLQRIGDGDFSTLEDIKEDFSVEPVNKEFYSRIAMLFTKLAGGERRIGKDEFKGKGLLHLPSTTDDTLNKEFTIRLIGRLVFCWFLKKKHSESGLPLLSNELLSLTALMKNENYYHSILEPLFFETLNTPAEERKKKFQLVPWAHVPFLNGGLFNPDEHDFYEVNELGISEFINVLKVPDKWIKDILEVFETYNFTIDENTSVDVELAIDPEILGRIFENLLAEINPETGETARKATGSYYTPRPIVEYMVDESLKQYLLTKVKISEDKVSSLLSYSNEEINLSESEKDSVLGALDVIKIIDPACGSGAFPMGILHKMLLILQKIDPDSKKWIERKLSRVESVTVRNELGKKLRKENWNYVHKLGIIQSSIYGVDIQPIATEISRLRFFLSLIVDEKVEDSEPNRGVDPLPNLEFKFVCANSLIPLAEEGGELFDNKEMAQQMQDIRDRYFKTDNTRIKVKMKKDFENVLKKGCSLFASRKQKQLLTYHPFDTNNICGFFDSKFIFGVDGFDIAIANPPYISFYSRQSHLDQYKEQVDVLREIYKFTDKSIPGRLNSVMFFIEKSLSLLKAGGLMTFIIDANFHETAYRNIRKYILQNSRILYFIDKFSIFENVNSDQVILSLAKENPSDSDKFRYIETFGGEDNRKLLVQKDLFVAKDYNFYVKEGRIKLPKDCVYLSEIYDTVTGVQIGIGGTREYKGKMIKDLFYSLEKKNKDYYPLISLKGKDFYKYCHVKFDGFLNFDISLGYKINKEVPKCNIAIPKYQDYLSAPKLIVRQSSSEIVASYTEQYSVAEYSAFSIKSKENTYSLKYLLAILNSKFITFYAQKYKIIKMGIKKQPQIRIKGLNALPVMRIPSSEQKYFIEIVDKILTITQFDDYILNQSKQAKVKEYERQIDQMVYELYGLTKEEVKVVEDFDKK